MFRHRDTDNGLYRLLLQPDPLHHKCVDTAATVEITQYVSECDRQT